MFIFLLTNSISIFQENSTEHAAAVPSKIEIPREIYLIVDYLHKNALTTPNLFTLDRKYQNNPNVNEIRDWLDIWAAHPFCKFDYRSLVLDCGSENGEQLFQTLNLKDLKGFN